MWMRILCVYLTLAVAQLPAEVLTYFAIREYGIFVERCRVVRWLIERFGYGGSLIASHLWKLLVMSPVIVWYYDFSASLGASFMGVFNHLFAIGIFLWDSIHDIIEWVRDMDELKKINKLLKKLSLMLSVIGLTPRRETREKDLKT